MRLAKQSWDSMSDDGPTTLLGDAILLDLEQLTAQVKEDGVLLPYQKRYLEEASRETLFVAEKSRRIGITWAEASDDVLFASTERPHGNDVSYIGYNLQMAREFIDACGDWARHFNFACSDASSFMFDQDEIGDKADRYIKAFQIDFASGNKIIALSSKPRSLRGRKGRVVIDEAAFHDDLEELIKAALALTIWKGGAAVRIISTHDGVGNAFNQLITSIRGKQRGGKVFRCTFEEAIADGLYERVCLVNGEEPTIEGKAEWVDGIRSDYGEAAKEELDVIPSKSGGAYISITLLEQQARKGVPVIRWTQPVSFTTAPKEARERETDLWLLRTVLPVLETLDPLREHAFGGDFGRSGDQSVDWVQEIGRDLKRRTRLVVELDNIPFEQQRQIAVFIIARLPRLRRAALDGRGNGEYLAEVLQQDESFGYLVEKIMLSNAWYLENMPPFKAALTDDALTIPNDADIIADHHLIKLIDGVAKIPKTKTKGESGKQRHGDSAVANALCYYASRQEPIAVEFQVGAQTETELGEMVTLDIGFGVVRRIAPDGF